MNLKKFKKIKAKKEKSIIVTHVCPLCNKENSFRIAQRLEDHTSATEVRKCHFCKNFIAFNINFEETCFGIGFSTNTLECAQCQKPIKNFSNALIYFNDELGDESTGGFVHKGKCEDEVDKLIYLGIEFYRNLRKGGSLTTKGIKLADQHLGGKL